MDTDVTIVSIIDAELNARAARRDPAATRAWRRLAAAGRRPELALAGQVVAALAFPATLLALWQLVAERGWVSPLILPPPALVAQTLRELWAEGTITTNLAVSAVRVAKGFGLGASAGLVLGTVLAVYQVNVMAWIPLLILLVGIDEPLKTAAIAYATLLPVTVNVANGIAGIPARWLELARVHQLRRHEVVFRIALPATVPSLFAGLRSGLGQAWMSLVVVELVASSEGVGFMVVWGRQLFQLDVVIAAIVVIGVVGLALDLVLTAAERRLQGWHRAAF